MSLSEVALTRDLAFWIDGRVIISANTMFPGEANIKVLARGLGIRWGRNFYESAKVGKGQIAAASNIILNRARYIDIGGHYRVDYLQGDDKIVLLQIGSGHRIRTLDEISPDANYRELLTKTR